MVSNQSVYCLFDVWNLMVKRIHDSEKGDVQSSVHGPKLTHQRTGKRRCMKTGEMNEPKELSASLSRVKELQSEW